MRPIGGSGVRIPGGTRNFLLKFFFRAALRPTEPSIQFVPGLFLAGNGRGVMLTTHLRLEQRLRMSGCVLLRPQDALMV